MDIGIGSLIKFANYKKTWLERFDKQSNTDKQGW